MTQLFARSRIGEGPNGLAKLSSAVLAVGLMALGAVAHGQAPFDPPTAEVLTEARTIVQDMIRNPRGPYSRVLWFCNDGSTQPPTPYACAERGGGRQHGEYSPARERLAALGWSVGTIFAALSFDELWDGQRRQQRLRELALERYMLDIDDGWVLRQARNYRGALQVEAEEAAGRRLLLELMGSPAWLEQNYLLARESVRVIPHGGAASDRTRDIRRAATELAELDSAFGPLRIEIHGSPDATTASRVRAWAAPKQGESRDRATAIADGLDALYGAAGRRARLLEWRNALARRTYTGEIAALLPVETTGDHRESLRALAAALVLARETIVGEERASAATRLLLFDTMSDLESELGVAAAALTADASLSRAELTELARHLVDGAYGGGLLTRGEYAALLAAWPASDATEITLPDYLRWAGYLRRVPQWAVGSVRYTFAEPLARYTALDRRAAAFVDDLLRGSPLVGLAAVARRAAGDVALMTGVGQNVNGETGVAAFGLNPGLATGRLKVLATLDEVEHGEYDSGDIVVLPETVPELKPVAGIVTLGEGSPLSHVQLLARNFGIPNISIVPSLLPALRELEGRNVLAAVASDGSVALLPLDALPAELRELAAPGNRTVDGLTVPVPDLSVRRPIRLGELNATLSGRTVGPKAANLGELARLFPGRVAPALAVPFGIFAEHVEAGGSSPRARLVAAYAAHRAGTLDDAALGTELAAIRAAIAGLELAPSHRAQLRTAMAEEFGAEPGYGLFIRSDTNVEDLPQFTGAGLSETRPNLVGEAAQLAAIPGVWASVLSPRAIAWRSSLLTNPEEVYASVLLMKSVPSEKSGVMVTTDVTTRGPGLTVSTAWGVGGAVGGEPTETLVLHDDGSVELVSEAKSAYLRELSPAGGLRWRSAGDGPVLTESDIQALRALALEVLEKYPPTFNETGEPRPWDIEFGFVGGELTLFQIRPLVERGPQLADRVVRALVPAGAVARHVVPLDERPSVGDP